MNPIQAAEDAVALVWGPASNEHTIALREALKGLLTHARTLEAELARKSAVADAYWEIVESYKAENAELRAAWAKARAEIEARIAAIQERQKFSGPNGSDGFRLAELQFALSILAQHAPQEG